MKNTAVTRMAFHTILFTCCWVLTATAQLKSYQLGVKGDTLNRVDKKGQKQGKWVERTAALRGNPGFEEEGLYLNSQKEGLWRKYTLDGDVLSMEHYHWGLLNGKAQYFTIEGLEREENWLALDPAKKFDTIDVPDLYNPDISRKVVIKNDGRSLKNGKWTYYDPRTGYILKSENYLRDSIDNPLAMFGIRQKTGGSKTDTTSTAKKEPKKTAVMEAWEKKNAGKKNVKVRDGRTF